MSANSNIKSSVIHTRTKPTPDGVILREVFRDQQPEKVWSGIEHTFFLIPSNDGCPIYFDDYTPTITTDSLVGSHSSEQLSTYEYDKGCFQGCDEIPSGVHKIVITPTLEGGVVIEEYDECQNCVIEKPVPQSEETTLSLEVDGVSQDYTFNVCSNEEPICIQKEGDGNNFYEELVFMDCKNDYGDSVHFESQDSKLSRALANTLGGQVFEDISNKISRIIDNTSSVDTADPEFVNDKALLLGGNYIDDLENIPNEVRELVRISSIDYNTLFGVNSVVRDDNEISLSGTDLLQKTDLITVGEKLWYQDYADPKGEVKCLIVPPKSVSNSLTFDDFVESDLDLTETYPLSELDVECVDTESCFWRKEGDVVNESYLNTDCLHKIPTKEEWEELCKNRIEYEILTNLSA